MSKLIAYFEGQCSELRRLIEESEKAREVAPYWLVEAQMNASIMNHMANAANTKNDDANF